MAKFGRTSLGRLAGVDRRLQLVLREAIRYADFAIITGHRTEAEQNAAYYAKPQRSKVKWPNSKHNSLPSMAVDIAPYPKMFSETDPVASAAEFAFVAGIIVGVARTMEVKLRWGGDWNGNLDTTDQVLKDWGHLEIQEET